MQTIFEKIDDHHAGLSPAKVARKYKLLMENPFRFFRGTNRLFYEDLCDTTIPGTPACWICGDLHIENFGSYKGDDRLVYFDLNDFDESILAPVGWELVRLLTSILVAFDELKITDEEAIKACRLLIEKYAAVIAEGNPRFIETRTAKGIVKKFLKDVEGRSQDELLVNRTIVKKGSLRLCDYKKKQLHIDKELKKQLCKTMGLWIESHEPLSGDYKVTDARFRVAGTGSMGVRRYVFLIEKISDSSKHMLIDMKQATASSLADLVKIPQPAWNNEAERMVTIQKVMQNVPPAQLGSIEFDGESFLIQELQPTKDRINFKLIEKNFDQICDVIEQLALLAASAHLRSIGRMGSCTADDLMAFGKDESWCSPIIDYALNYKKKVISDFEEFTKNIKSRKTQKSVAEGELQGK